MTNRSYAKNAFYNMFGMVLYIVLNILLMPVLINTMGEVQYALYRLALYTLVGYGLVLDFGLRAGVQRALSDAINEHRLDDAKVVLGMAMKTYGAVSLIVCIVGIPTYIYYPAIVNTPPELVEDFRFLIVATIIYIVAYLFQIVWNGIFVIFSRFDLIQKTFLSGRLLFVVVGLALMKMFGYPLIMIGSAAAVIMSITCLYSIKMVKSEWKEFGVSFNRWDSKTFKAMYAFGVYGVLISIGSILVDSTLNIFISNKINLESVSIFAVSFMIAHQIVNLISTVSTPIYAEASKSRANRDAAKNYEQLKFVLSVSIFFYVVVAAPIAVSATDIVLLWIGEKMESAGIIASVLVIGIFSFPFCTSARAVLNAAGSIKHLATITIVWGIATLGILYSISFFTSITLFTIAVIYAISYSIQNIAMYVYACVQFKADFVKETIKITLIEVFALTAGIVVSYCIRNVFFASGSGYFVCFAYLIVSAAAVFPISYYLVLDAKIRKSVYETICTRLKSVFALIRNGAQN